MIKRQKKSCKTTICGFISAVGYGLTQSGNPTLEIIGQFLLPIGTLCTGYYAKDNSVED